MFDKLIESDTAAVVKPRRNYFVVSTVVVGILFLTAVVISLYAENIDLGVDEFETAMLLAPVASAAPEPPKPEASSQQQTASTDQPNRQSNTQRTEESPIDTPPISMTPNTQLSRPIGKFNVSDLPETNGFGGQGTANSGSGGTPGGSGTRESQPESVAKTEADPEPPPVKKVEESKPKPLKSDGVVNGKATYLPTPAYPPPAKAVGAEGDVNVQVTIDEQGNVISSHALSGHPLLRQAAEKAAWSAKFSPTLLSKVPVKVTGVILYRFKR